MNKMSPRLLLAVFSLLVAIMSCSSKNALIVGRLPVNTQCLAVMPFVTQGDPQRTEREFLSEFVASDLFREGVSGIIYPTEILKAYRTAGVDFPEKAEMSYAKEVVKVLGIDSVLWGEISYRTVLEDIQIDAKGTVSGKEVYLIAIEAYLIDGAGAVRWYYDSKKVSNYENDVTVLAGISSEMAWGLLRSQKGSYGEERGCIKTALPDRIALLKGSYKTRPLPSETVGKAFPKGTVPGIEITESEMELSKMGTEAPQKQLRPLNEREKLTLDSLLGGKKIVLQELDFAGRTPNLSKNGIIYLNSLGNVLSNMPNYRFIFESHVDATADTAADMNLSLERVKNVKVFMVKYFNIDSGSLEIKALGGQIPILPNITKRGREKNRRIELTAVKAQ